MRPLHYAIAALVTLLDLATKAWIVFRFALHEDWPIIPGLFSLTYVLNTGVAFGMLQALNSPTKPWILSLIALAALTALMFFGRSLRNDQGWSRLALAGIAGGILGNLVDRLYDGAVIDFLDFYWKSWHWPTFNIADSAITVGVLVLIRESWRSQ